MLKRINIELAIPEKVFDKIPAERKQAFIREVRAMKNLAVKINEGKANEEMTVKAVWHRCGHDEGKACEPEQEI